MQYRLHMFLIRTRILAFISLDWALRLKLEPDLGKGEEMVKSARTLRV